MKKNLKFLCSIILSLSIFFVNSFFDENLYASAYQKPIEDMPVYLTVTPNDYEIGCYVSLWIVSDGTFASGEFSMTNFMKDCFIGYDNFEKDIKYNSKLTKIESASANSERVKFSFRCNDSDGLYDAGRHEVLTFYFKQEMVVYSDLWIKSLKGTINGTIPVDSVYYYDLNSGLLCYDKISGESFFECDEPSELAAVSYSYYDALMLSFWSNDKQDGNVYEINYNPYLLYPREIISINCDAQGDFSELWKGKLKVSCENSKVKDNENVELFWVYFEVVSNEYSTAKIDVHEITDKKISFSQQFPVRGHKYKINTVNATCNKSGKIVYDYYDKDWKYFEVEIPLDENAHLWNNPITTSATCTSEGIVTYTCRHNSAHTKTENLGINASNHANIKNVAEVKATCTTKGTTAGTYCNDCKKYISGHKETVINPSNHVNTKTVPATPATFDAIGYTAGVYCNDCKKYISGHTEIPKLVPEFTDSNNAKESGSNIVSNNGLTVAQLLSQAGKGATIKTKDGKAVENAALIGTGMVLTMADGTTKEIVVYGDADGDGKISAADARLALRASVGLETVADGSCYYKAINVDNGDIASSDARDILRASVGLEDSKKWMK